MYTLPVDAVRLAAVDLDPSHVLTSLVGIGIVAVVALALRTQRNLDNHMSDSGIHITPEERAAVVAHIGNGANHVTTEEKQSIAESKARDKSLEKLIEVLFNRIDSMESQLHRQTDAMQQLNREASGARRELRDALHALRGSGDESSEERS